MTPKSFFLKFATRNIESILLKTYKMIDQGYKNYFAFLLFLKN